MGSTGARCFGSLLRSWSAHWACLFLNAMSCRHSRLCPRRRAFDPTPTSAELGSAATITATATVSGGSTYPMVVTGSVQRLRPTETPAATATRTPEPLATTTPSPATPVQPPSPLPAATKTNPLDGAQYVYVPAGSVQAMGSERRTIPQARGRRETPGKCRRGRFLDDAHRRSPMDSTGAVWRLGHARRRTIRAGTTRCMRIIR